MYKRLRVRLRLARTIESFVIRRLIATAAVAATAGAASAAVLVALLNCIHILYEYYTVKEITDNIDFYLGPLLSS